MKRIIFGLLFGISLSAYGQPSSPELKVKNVILMIADGTGISQITAGMYANGDATNYERCPYIGLHKQHSSDNLITDSAAGATAFSCGKKTYNGAIGVDAEGKSCPTLLEIAEESGCATGLVATSTIVHATPASFIAHVAQRKQYEDIATYFPASGIDYFVGGGKKYFDRRESDERNLIEELKKEGFQVGSYFDQDFEEWSFNERQAVAFFTSDSDPLPYSQGRTYLKDATERGISFLEKRSEKGFFLMIEGSQVDWGGHANKSDYLIQEMKDFDRTLGAVLDFAEKDGNTLVIVTGDHECGGFAINYGSTRDSIQGAFTSDYHTADMIPVFAFGPGSEQFAGIYQNTEIFEKIRRLTSW
jgi:alkaline phosphatase